MFGAVGPDSSASFPQLSVTSCLCSPEQAGFVNEAAFSKGLLVGQASPELSGQQATGLRGGFWRSQNAVKERSFPGQECTGGF